MAYRYGNREQFTFLPPSIEEYVGPEDQVRAYDAFVDALDLSDLGITYDIDKVGNSSYDPKAMLKLLVYGYAYGIRSARKLERAVLHNLSFMWLVSGLQPDYKTISEFRRKNKKAIAQVLKQCARFCVEIGLIAGNTLFVDGTHIRANANIKNSWDSERCEKALKKVDERIEAILSECEKVDKAEENEGSLVKLGEELQNNEDLRAKVEGILNELKTEKKKSINTTDPDCVKSKSTHGTHATLNAQSVVDEKHGLIVHTDVVSESNDRNQLGNQIESANKTVGGKCENAIADAGYDNVDELEKFDGGSIKAIVASQKHSSGKTDPKFDKEKFTYDREKDCYICPEGQVLPFRSVDTAKNIKIYQGRDPQICLSCPNFQVCTKSKDGRKITRLKNEEVRERSKALYEKPESQVLYKLRSRKVELPFGHIRRNLQVSAFHLRGLEGARAEMSLLATCFNMARMITIFGVSGLVAKFTGAA